MTNSRRKGKAGELDFSHFLTDNGFPARRGQQFSGGNDSPDVICDALDFAHFEVKRCERGNPYDWVAQALSDSDRPLHVVAHRRNGKDWLAIMPMHELMELLKR